MNMQIYEASLFWVLLGRFSDLMVTLTPLLIFIACLYWLSSSRNKISTLALTGSVFSVGGRLYELVFPGLNVVYSADGPRMIDDNGFNIFFYLYAESIGYFIFAICLFIYFSGKYRNT
jgi:hypothetical protein